MVVKVCLAGATGWAGSALACAIAKTADLRLVAAVSRRHAGRSLGEVLSEPLLTCPVYPSVAEALADPCDVLVEYTKPDSAKINIQTALERGAHVVVGTSGLTDGDFADIDALARKQHRGVLACGNFALTVVLLQKFAEAAAKLIPQWEIIDYAHDDKIDAPSETARELAARLSRVRHPETTVPVDRTVGPREARGATLSGSQVHSVRLPGYVISAEIIFGMPDQKLTLRHDSGSSARPYVDGALLAIRKVSTLIGVHRGLDSVLDLCAHKKSWCRYGRPTTRSNRTRRLPGFTIRQQRRVDCQHRNGRARRRSPDRLRRDIQSSEKKKPHRRSIDMSTKSVLTTAMFSAALLGTSATLAQQPAATNPLDAIPEKIPFDVPYGAPISLERAEAAIVAAVAEAKKRDWKMNVAVVDSGGNLVAFQRMDGAQLASIAISEHKARAAATFRRETKAYESAIQQNNLNYVLTLDGIIASRGGIPLLEGGKLIGAIGCSGGTGSQDEVACKAGAGVIK